MGEMQEIDEPENFSEAITRVERDSWVKATNEELDSFCKCKTWRII